MSRQIKHITSIIVSLFITINGFATIISSVQDGNWTSTSTWDLGILPVAGDTIYISLEDTVVITSNFSLSGAATFIVIDGTLEFNGGGAKINLDTGSGITVNATGNIITTGGGGGASQTIVIDGTTEWQKSQGDVTGPAPGFGTPIVFNPLPVELVHFSQEVNGQSVKIFWTVASQTNNDYFTLFRSNDGIKYELVHAIPGDGTLNMYKSFQYTDLAPGFGTFYYKLVQTDILGEPKELAVAAVKIGGLKTQNVWPLPVRERFQMDLESTLDGMFSIEITTLTGELVFTEARELLDGFNRIEIERPMLNSGIYLLRISNESGILLVEKLPFE